jgi:hypothetical protein
VCILQRTVPRPGYRCPTKEEDEKFLLSTTLLLFLEIRVKRKLLPTEYGMFGLGSEHMKLGDVAVILAGAPTPYILRLKDTQDCCGVC